MSATSAHPETTNWGYRMPMFLVIVCALIAGSVWQYRNVLIELHQLASSDLYQHVLNVEAEPDSSERVYGLNVALIGSHFARRLAGENKENFDENLRAWENVLSRNEFSYDRLKTVPAIEDAYQYNLMVLPAVPAMSDQEILDVKAFLKTGRGVFMTWGSGTQNEHGQWRKYSLMQEVAGIEPNGLPPNLPGDLSGFRMLNQQVLSSVMPSGMTVAMSRYDQPVSGRILEERTQVDGVWSSNANGRAYEAFFRPRDHAAIAHGDYLGGRFVWMGFTMNSSIGVMEQANAMQATLRESLLWAGKQIRVVKPNWPGGQPSALSITQNLRVVGGLDLRLIEIASEYNVPVTSFVGREVLEQVPEMLHRFEAAGEVGLLIDAGNKNEITTRHLKKMRKEIKSITGTAPIGCRVEGIINKDLASNLIKAGFVYVSSATHERLVPQVLRSYRPVQVLTRPRYLWQIPEMVAVGLDGSPANMYSHVSEALALGGYCCLSFDPSQLDDEMPGHLSGLLARAREEKIWTTTSREVSETWAWWDNIRVAAKPISRTQTSIQISNTGLTHAPGIDLVLQSHDPAQEVEMEAMTLGNDLPRLTKLDAQSWSVRFDDIRAGKNLSYKVHFKEGAVLTKR